MLYTIEVRLGYKYHEVSVSEQRPGRGRMKFHWKIRCAGRRMLSEGGKNDLGFVMKRHSFDYAKTIFKFFLRTRKANSKEWTEFWHVKKAGKYRAFKLYDCSERYLLIGPTSLVRLRSDNCRDTSVKDGEIRRRDWNGSRD